MVYTGAFLFVGYFSRAFLFLKNLSLAYSAVEQAGVVSGMASILYTPNGSDLATPACALLGLVAARMLKEKKLNVPFSAALFIAAVVTTGAKYVFAVCIIGAFIGSVVFLMIQRRPLYELRLTLSVLFFIICGFILPYVQTCKRALAQRDG